MEYVISIREFSTRFFLSGSDDDFTWTKNVGDARHFARKTDCEAFRISYMQNFAGLEIEYAILLENCILPYFIVNGKQFEEPHFFIGFNNDNGKPVWTPEIADAMQFKTCTHAMKYMMDNENSDFSIDDIQIEIISMHAPLVLGG